MTYYVNNLVTLQQSGIQLGTTNTVNLSSESVKSNVNFLLPDVSQSSTTFLTTDYVQFSAITNGSATITLPSSSDTLVGKNTTDTLTNKTLTGSTNNIEANKIGQGSNATTIRNAPTTNQVLTCDGTGTASWSNILDNASLASIPLSVTNSLTTTAGSTGNIISFPVDLNAVYYIKAIISGKKSDATACVCLLEVGYKGVTKLQSETKTLYNNGKKVTISLSNTSTNIIISVAGDKDDVSITWRCIFTYYKL
jgi:hypothetical protein